MGTQGNHHRLEPVGHQGDEHRRRIEEKVPQECTHAAHKEGPQGVQQNGGGTDHGIVQIQVPAGHGDTEGAHGNIQRHEHGGNGQPFHRLVFAQIRS